MTAIALASIAEFRVPDTLAEHDQWVLWRYESRKGKPTKVPYQVSGNRADSTSPKTWASFEEALRAWQLNRQRYTGLGFVFSKEDSLVGVDLDDSLDERGEVKAWATRAVERFSDTYTEISPSGQGLKIWARGSLPANLPGVQIGDGAIELYNHSRYFAVTGRAFRGAPLDIEDHTEDLQRLYERLTADRKGWPIQPLPGGQIPHGRQHSTLVSLCGTLRARSVCDQAIEACLQIVNEKQCEKPGARENISRIIRSSRKWGIR
jgi:hypothetical protein